MKNISSLLIFVFLFLSCYSKTEKASSTNVHCQETTEAKEEVICDSLDYILPQKIMGKIDFGRPVKYHELTNSEILKVKKILSDYLAEKRKKEIAEFPYSENIPYTFDKYIRQYLAIEKNGEIIVMVHLIGYKMATYLGISKKSLQSDLIFHDGGGSNFASAEINLSTGSIISYHQNIM
ncbi:MAG: hypothetical protein IJR20_03000 [Muribaculaceae bacterium]|nr:hypothetical protein [Muribaculaceae bacterium]